MSAPGLGHNNGPTLEGGASWRKYCWSHARRQLLPQMPLEIVRQRVRRAAEIGLDYRTYATVRATTGTDIVAFLFSNNALAMFRADQQIETARADKMRAIRKCSRMVAAHPPLSAEKVVKTLGDQGVAIDHAIAAPGLQLSWSETAEELRALVAKAQLSPKSVLVIGETALEREWPGAGRFAGFVTGQSYFQARN